MNYKKILSNDIFVFFLLLILFYAVFRYADTFNQGFNIVEDHFLISTNQSLDTQSFSSVFREMMRNELVGIQRFRPVWVLYVLATIKIFGINLLLINIYLCILCTISSFLLYKFCRNIDLGYLPSLFFPLLTMIGPAIIIYIRPPDAEIIGMLMLSTTLFFLSKSIYTTKNKFLFCSAFILFLTLMMLCKESFMVTTPAIIFLYGLVYSFKNKTGILATIKSNKFIFLIASGILLFLLLYLITKVGINHKEGYSGVDINLFSGKVIKDFTLVILKNQMFYVALLGIIILLINFIRGKKTVGIERRNPFGKVFLVFVFMLMVITPQFILYYKTGFFVGRYYLPFLIGFTFLLIYVLSTVLYEPSISKPVKYIYVLIVFSFQFYQLKTEALPGLVEHSNTCRANTEMINYIAKSSDKRVLVVMDPIQNYYNLYSLRVILDYVGGKKDYKYDFVYSDNVAKLYSDSTFSNHVLMESTKSLGSGLIDSTKDYSDISNIMIFWSLDKKFTQKNKNWFNENEYEKNKFGYFTLYSK